MSRLSILLLCWNHARFLERCIGALAAQTCRDFDVVFLDNGSTDGSENLARKLLREARIPHRILVNKTPAGIATNVNRQFASSGAALAASLSTDDWYAPRYVEAMLEAADAYPEAGLFYPGGWIYFDETGQMEPVDTASHLSGDLYLPLMRRQKPMFFVGTCCRRTAFDAIGGFDEELQIEDYDFFVRLACRFPIQCVDEPLVYYRRSAGAISSNFEWMIEGWEQFYRKHKDLPDIDLEDWMAETYRAHAALAIDQGSHAVARRLLRRSLELKPFRLSSYRTLAYLLRRSISGGKAP